MDIQETDLYQQLKASCRKLRQYYDIDKIKPYSVYIWTKSDDGYGLDGSNIFDIHYDTIDFYEDHTIPKEVLSIIREIQWKLRLIKDEMEKLSK